MEKFVMVSGDGFPRMFGQGERGQGHALLIQDGFWGDALAVGGKISRACGGTLECGKAVEKFVGEKQCPKCAAWIATQEGAAAVDRARSAYATWEDGGESVAELFSAAEVTNGTDAPEAAPEVREITREEVKAIVRKSKGAQVKAKRAAAIEREKARLAERKAEREARENSAPDVKVSGWNVPAEHAAMVAATATYYANGGQVSPEILALPAPGTVNLSGGTVSGSAAEILVCAFKGETDVVNPERTHGKCPECTTYIPLLPGETWHGKAKGPQVSKIACEGVGTAPKSGTQVLRDDHTVSVPDGHDGKTSAPCPTCDRMIAVSREGGMRRHNGTEVREESAPPADKIGKHNVGGVATPAGKGLKSKSLDTVDHGSVPGDPATADRRRAAEIKESGSDARKFKGGADTGATVAKGARLALGRGQGMTDGSATTGRQSMAPVQPGGWLGRAGTMSLPAQVRPGIDPEVSGRKCPICDELPEIAHAGKSKSWRRRHNTRVGAILRDRKAARELAYAAKIESGEIIPRPERRAARVAASTGSFAEGTVAGSVAHAKRPEHSPKGTRKPAPRPATAQEKADARKALASVK